MNTEPVAFYGGISDVEMIHDKFELGHGLFLRKTYARLMNPLIFSFSAAKEGEPHPAPWRIVDHDNGTDIKIELFIPGSLKLPNFFDQLNTIWWIIALIRLRGAGFSRVPVISQCPFAEFALNQNKFHVTQIETLPRYYSREAVVSVLSEEDLQWLRKTWLTGGTLMSQSQSFRDAFYAIDRAGELPIRSVSVLLIWSALEKLFSPAKQELRFRVSAHIAAYLEPIGDSRLRLHKQIMKLYDARSEIAHSAKVKTGGIWSSTYSLAKRVLMKILSDNFVPSMKELEGMLFAPEL